MRKSCGAELSLLPLRAGEGMAAGEGGSDPKGAPCLTSVRPHHRSEEGLSIVFLSQRRKLQFRESGQACRD